MPNIEIHYTTGEGWAGLYVNGRLERVGDAYVAREKAFEMLGVKVVQSDDFMLGQTSAAGAAQTLGEIATYRAGRISKLKLALEKREQARKLIEEADKLDPTAQTG